MANILVLDSEIEICCILSEILKTKGHKVYSTSSGYRALEILKRKKISLVISGFNLVDIGYNGLIAEFGKMPQQPKLIRIVKSKKETYSRMTDVVKLPIENDLLLEFVENKLEKEKLKKPKDFSKLWKITCAVIIIVLIVLYFLRPEKKDRIKILPSKNISGISFSNDKIYLCDWFEKDVYVIDKDSFLSDQKKNIYKIEKKIFKDKEPIGVAYIDKYVWMTDINKKAIIKYDISGTPVALERISAPGSSPATLFYDGYNLWSSDTFYKKIYKHNFDNQLSIVDVLSPEVKFLSGFFIKKKKIYIADGDDNVILVYNKYFNLIYKYKLKYYTKGNRLGVIGTDGNNIFSIPEGTNMLIIHSEKGMEKIKIKKR